MREGTALSKDELLAITWAFTGIAFGFFVTRILIRLRVYNALKLDDGLVISAMSCTLAAAIVQTVMVPYTMTVQAVQLGVTSTPPHYHESLLTYGKYQWGVSYLFFTSIWLVKGTFLAFYDDLTSKLPWYRRAWMAIIVFTVLTYIGSLLAYGLLNGLKLGDKDHKNQAIRYQFAADFTTDVLITALPLTLAFKSKIPRKRKLGLAGIFSLTLVITVFSIVRFALNSPNLLVDPSTWLQAWSTIEQTVSITVVCLPSFRTLAVSKRRSTYEHHSSDRIYPKSPSDRKRAIRNQSGFSQLDSANDDGAAHNDLQSSSRDIELQEASRAANHAQAV